MVRREMARVNFDILGIPELKRTGMGDLIQMTIISTNVHLVKTMVFPVVMYRCESGTVKKAEH